MKLFKALPTQAELWKMFNYHSDGYLIWRIKPAKNINIGDRAGSVNERGYTHISVNGVRYKAHRLIYKFFKGDFNNDLIIDHDDSNPLNNRVENLKAITQKENIQKKKQHSNNISGLSWVSWYKTYKKWQAQYQDENGKRKFLGYFTSKYEAYHLAAEATAKVKGKNHKEQLSTEGRHAYMDWLLEQNPNPDYDWMNE